MPSCLGGPPCHSVNGEQALRTSTPSSASTSEVTYSDLTRTISSTDFADIFILDIKNKLLMTYNRYMVPNSAPAMFQYVLAEADKDKLKEHIGKKIFIKKVEHTQPGFSSTKNYKLVL